MGHGTLPFTYMNHHDLIAASDDKQNVPSIMIIINTTRKEMLMFIEKLLNSL